MSEEQASTLIEISERNTSIFEISNESRDLAQEAAKVIYNLSQQMNDYRLKFLDSNIVFNDQDIINVGKTDHLLWKWNIYNMILGLVDLTESDVGSHEVCRLGKWYYDTSLSPKIKNHQAYKNLEGPHMAVHDYARQAVAKYRQGEIDEAKKDLN